MADLPPYGWPIPLRSDKPAGARQITDLATKIAATIGQVETRIMADRLFARRTATDSFASGAMIPVGVTASGDVPAGVYLLSWLAITSSTAARVSQYVRVVANGANMTADARSQFADADLIQSVSGTVPYVHTGGPLSVALQLQHSSGTGTIYPSSYISAVRVGDTP